jgi:c-di-AMP phosphodiesterase-like protein
MKINFKKTYKFAIKSALFISLFATGFVLLMVVLFFGSKGVNLFSFGFICLVVIYLFSFLVLQYRVERFIYWLQNQGKYSNEMKFWIKFGEMKSLLEEELLMFISEN